MTTSLVGYIVGLLATVIATSRSGFVTMYVFGLAAVSCPGPK
ncbi:MAG TPA: hypothetical protein VIX37_07520 [Candidatus Sulfotelmatobacter sp.]